MSDSQLTNPPVIDTDISTNELFYTDGGGALRYVLGAHGILGMDLTPAGHGTGNQGIYAIVACSDSPLSGTGSSVEPNSLRVASRLESRKLQDYAMGWKMESDMTIPPVNYYTTHTFYGTWIDDPNLVITYDIRGQVASQRLGNFVYIFGYVIATQFDPIGNPRKHEDNTLVSPDAPHNYTEYGATTLGQFDPVINDYPDYTPIRVGTYNIWKIGPDGSTTSIELIDWNNFSNLQPILGLNSVFVSDDAEPFIWHVSGDISSLVRYPEVPLPYTITNLGQHYGTRVWSQGWSDRGGPYESGREYVIRQADDYLQYITSPPGVYGFGPYLTFPWSCGRYGPPELWFYVHRGGSMFDIYRTQWGRGQKTPAIGDSRYSINNPEGWGFQEVWYTPGNKIGQVGPFAGADIYNPLIDGGTPGPGQIVVPYFRVLRDTYRIGKLHLVFGGEQEDDQWPVNPILKGFWYTQSGNDGRKWGTATRTMSETSGYHLHSMAAVRTYDNQVIVGIEHLTDADSLASLVALTYNPVGVAEPIASDVIFKGVHALE